MLRRTFSIGLAALAFSTLGQSAQAGYSTIGLFAYSANDGSSLANATTVTFGALDGTANSATVLTSSGIFATAGVSGDYATATLDLASLSGFTLSSAAFGTFTAGASDGMGNVSEVVTHTANFLDVYLIGAYTGLPGDPGSADTSLRISINDMGPDAGLATLTLSTPPATVVPEPASITLLGLGVVAVGGLASRRRPTNRP